MLPLLLCAGNSKKLRPRGCTAAAVLPAAEVDARATAAGVAERGGGTADWATERTPCRSPDPAGMRSYELVDG